jgi:amino acid transporter
LLTEEAGLVGYRVVFTYSFAFLAWVFVCLVELMIFGFNVLLGSFGGVIGLILGVLAALWQFKKIEKDGEFKATRKMWAFALLAVIVLVLSLTYFTVAYFALYLALIRQIASFLFLILPPFYASQVGLFLNWERRQKRHILSDGFMSTRVYAYPQTEKR